MDAREPKPARAGTLQLISPFAANLAFYSSAMYWLELVHNVSYGGLTAEQFDQRVLAYLQKPWWRRLFLMNPRYRFQADGSEYERLPGSYGTLAEADTAATALARELTGKLRDDTAVAIVAEADGKWVDGIYLNDGGRF